MAKNEEKNNAKTNRKINYCSLLSTVSDKRASYTCADIEEAQRAIIYRGILGWRAKNPFKNYVTNNLLLN